MRAAVRGARALSSTAQANLLKGDAGFEIRRPDQADVPSHSIHLFNQKKMRGLVLLKFLQFEDFLKVIQYYSKSRLYPAYNQHKITQLKP